MAEQIVTNLVQNAILYNRPGGHVVVLLELVRRDRSEERRVGKSVDLGGRRIIKKKNHQLK